MDFSDLYGSLLGLDRDIEQIQFWVRGSGKTTGTHNIKVEIKDISSNTAYRYISIDDGNPIWEQMVLDADVTNGDFWSYPALPPDPTQMKQMVFVIESYFNNSTGTFYLDDITFVDADDAPFDPASHSDDEFLAYSASGPLLGTSWIGSTRKTVYSRTVQPSQTYTAPRPPVLGSQPWRSASPGVGWIEP